MPDSGELVIVGDTHGQLSDVLWILTTQGLPGKDRAYVINGDIADRGDHAVEIFIIVYLLFMVYLMRDDLEGTDHEADYIYLVEELGHEVCLEIVDFVMTSLSSGRRLRPTTRSSHP